MMRFCGDTLNLRGKSSNMGMLLRETGCRVVFGSFVVVSEKIVFIDNFNN
jgi:hypothetical protein